MSPFWAENLRSNLGASHSRLIKEVTRDPVQGYYCLFMPTTWEAIKILATNLYENVDIIPGSAIVKDYIKRSYQNDPFRVALEALLLFFAIRYMTTKKYQINSNYVKLTKKEVDDLVEEWTPEALVPESTPEQLEAIEELFTVKEHRGIEAIMPDGKKLLNWSVSNFLGLHNSAEMKAKCADIVKGYGVGTCGPSGFYGTIDVHLDLQKELSRVFETEAAIIYAQGYSAVASVIPAFSKKGDVIVADEASNFAIQRGLTLSKSQVHYFKHNDMADLERILIKIDADFKKKKTPLTRRFIVTEGLFQNTGQICPLPELVDLKKKYKYRLIVDESASFGAIGPRCRGACDYFNIPAREVEVIVGTLSNSIGSAGGFCVGDKNIIDHQVLSSQAYCYSASLPAFLAAAAIVNIHRLSQEGSVLADRLASNIAAFRATFSPYPRGMELRGAASSPLLYLSFVEGDSRSYQDQREALKNLVTELKKSDFLVCLKKSVQADEKLKQPPMIKITISAAHSLEQVKSFASTLLRLANKQC